MPDRSVRETYDLPEKPPLPHRHWALMVIPPILVLVLWFVLPKSPVFVALLFLITIVVVFTGVRMVLGSRGLSEKPGRNPVQPPSTR